MTKTPQRILIVDDEADIVLISSLMLQADGHTFDSAGDCATALAMASSKPYDIVLLDLGLPDGDGRDVLRQWKKDGLVPRMRVLIVSAFGFEIVASELDELGAAGYLRKPYSSADLIRAVDEASEVASP